MFTVLCLREAVTYTGYKVTSLFCQSESIPKDCKVKFEVEGGVPMVSIVETAATPRLAHSPMTEPKNGGRMSTTYIQTIIRFS